MPSRFDDLLHFTSNVQFVVTAKIIEIIKSTDELLNIKGKINRSKLLFLPNNCLTIPCYPALHSPLPKKVPV